MGNFESGRGVLAGALGAVAGEGERSGVGKRGGVGSGRLSLQHSAGRGPSFSLLLSPSTGSETV